MSDIFKERASEWDSGSMRVKMANAVANAIKERVVLNSQMTIMDFGVGTGLLGFEIAKEVKHVCGVDTSSAMLAKLQEKNSETVTIEPVNQDIIQNPLERKFNGVISSMTLHHVENTAVFSKESTRISLIRDSLQLLTSNWKMVRFTIITMECSTLALTQRN